MTITRETIKKLNPRHEKMIDLALQGWPNNAIADHFKMSPRQVSVVLSGPLAQHKIAIRRKTIEDNLDSGQPSPEESEVQQILRQGARAAAEKLCHGVRSENESIALKSSSEILDRTGHPRTQKVEGSSGVSISITSTDVQLLTEALNEDKASRVQVTSKEKEETEDNKVGPDDALST
jgi:hypothetical protein